MANDGASSSTRRIPLPPTVKCVEAAEERDEIAPTCRCGVYAILYKSRTTTNPNRLFFGYPFFKVSEKSSHCKFFLWLDDHVSTIRVLEKFITENEVDDLKVYLGKKVVEQKLIDLEKKVLHLERKKNVNLYLIILAVVSVIFASVIAKLG
ncbi:uncharacterized protein LOC107607815 [Arachis ipaensis]|uniref:uncharacterized protein LOC107607815 n=1 Tax=Arachis ipaensis TaxID=130454 RepID=UPI0007AF66AC|nr:uncharacterized protein LOC107607815 [Arachis ipaensis]